ncbi:DUF1799 domain-containing protein [Paracoccus sanguinis]|uniref:DUF1799 domain-containing protein n=1 Tax=Paracoccus sanguinis TaxID=1545044 RepID=A0A1H2STF5_9RHOB|nr:DUF1799 domain-containing protein [Paracoccus sanguinis]KGJ19306.1 hypothetical protein IX57_00130 [Paracoccus sanguinis]SDW34304.1 Phage related hypothetical protein [Paracoccus sanguinis]
MAAQFAALGVTVAAEAPREDEAFEIMQANADTMRAWLACATQWRCAAGMAGLVWLGLDYAGVNVVLARGRVAEPDAVFADLQLMEDEALATFAEGRA